MFEVNCGFYSRKYPKQKHGALTQSLHIDCKNREVLILKLAPSKLELILNKYKVINITS